MRVVGFNDLVNGFAGLEDTPTYYPNYIRAVQRMKEYGFKSESETDMESEFTSAPKPSTNK